MAATTSQGKQFTLFMVGLTAVCAGIAFFASGTAKVVLIAGAIVLAISLWGLFKIKPLEGKTGGGAQPAVTKLIGVAVVLGRLALCAVRIAPDGQRGRANGDLDCGVSRLDRRNLLRACAGCE